MHLDGGIVAFAGGHTPHRGDGVVGLIDHIERERKADGGHCDLGAVRTHGQREGVGS